MTNTSLAADLSSATNASSDPCRMCMTLNELEPEDAAAVRSSLASGIPIEQLWKLLKKHEHQTPMRHIRDHKKEGHQ